MKALILNSGMGSRMGVLTSEHPKCMTEIYGSETILSRQLRQLADAGVYDVVMTTGRFDQVLMNYCRSLDLPLRFTFVRNPEYAATNYIYSIFCARNEVRDDDVLLLHGDLVFESTVLQDVLDSPRSCMTVSASQPLPKKDFKAVLQNGRISKVGVSFFENAVMAQPLYHLKQADWHVWLAAIERMVGEGQRGCYAENALNEVTDTCMLYPLDVGDRLCAEVDTAEDLSRVARQVAEVAGRTVYMCFSTDMLHSGHIELIRKAARLGRLIVGVLSDEAVMSYKRFPLLPFAERKAMFSQLAGVKLVVEQKTLSYRDNLLRYRPTYVVHGDDWRLGVQKPVREEVIATLGEYGGQLVEYPYASDPKYKALEDRARADLSLPDMRRARLRKAIDIKGTITALEAHSGITGLIVEKTMVGEGSEARQFDAMWVSSLCDSTSKGKPDIELVDMTSRYRTIDDIMEVTTKPIIFDGDTGGLVEHFVYTVRTLERMGVSMVIIEDKTGLKKNSLFGNEVPQTQDTIEHFCAKIAAGKKAQKTRDFMICARIESLILEKGMDDALKRAFAFRDAGADAIMIHSRKRDPAEIFEFVNRFRAQDKATPLVVIPTSYNQVTEEEFRSLGVNVVIYANQLTRAGFPAMQTAAKTILAHHRALECDEMLMPIQDIIRLIPEET